MGKRGQGEPRVDDLSTDLGTIAAIRQQLADSDRDITPRLIRWGLVACVHSGVNLRAVRRRWPELSPYERWQRVRLFVPNSAVRSLARKLEAEYGAPSTQLDLFEGDTPPPPPPPQPETAALAYLDLSFASWENALFIVSELAGHVSYGFKLPNQKVYKSHDEAFDLARSRSPAGQIEG